MVEEFVARGAPPKKLLMGIPMYSRGNRNYGVAKTMGEIVDENEKDATILLDSSSAGDMHWESPKLFANKVRFAVKNGLNGVFFWEIGQDYQSEELAPGGVLLEETYKVVKKFVHEEEAFAEEL